MIQATNYFDDRLARRREKLLNSTTAFGIDYVRPCRHGAVQKLEVHFLGKVPTNLADGNFKLYLTDPEKPLNDKWTLSGDVVTLGLNFKPDPKAVYTLKLLHGLDDAPPTFDNNNKTLTVQFQGVRPASLETTHFLVTRVGSDEPVEITGLTNGQADLSVTLTLNDPGASDSVEFRVALAPDFMPGLDPHFAESIVRFDCKEESQSDIDARLPARAQAPPAPEIDYLAKDYATFRQLLLDRLAVTMPNWRERSPADLGVVLVEILAYAADHLSYQQDAVATEAYLGTARLRPSLRRHARLLDYRVHEGCNARVWMHLRVFNDSTLTDPRRLFFLVAERGTGDASTGPLTAAQLVDLAVKFPNRQVFEPLESKDIELHVSHNEIALYDWLGANPCLPKNSNKATLVDCPPEVYQHRWRKYHNLPCAAVEPVCHKRGPYLQLQKGDWLLLEELRDPRSGDTADVHIEHRHVVRLTKTTRRVDPLTRIPLLEVEWNEADRLPFTLWLDRDDGTHAADEQAPPKYAVARGNLLLADHGRSTEELVTLRHSTNTPPGAAPELSNAAPNIDPQRSDPESNYPQGLVQAALAVPGLTFSADLPAKGEPASRQLEQSPQKAQPNLVLQEADHDGRMTEVFSFLELRNRQRVVELLRDLLLKSNSDDDARRRAGLVLGASVGCGERLMEFVSKDPNDQLRITPGYVRLWELVTDRLNQVWTPQHDLLSSQPTDAHFVVEMTDDRQAQLRFGRHGLGRTPDLAQQTRMRALLRVGNGAAGNVPANAIVAFGAHRGSLPPIESVTNPLAAQGGVDPEAADEVRLRAPHYIKSRLERAVTPADYETLAVREFPHEIQAARATLVQRPLETTVLLAIDPLGKEVASPELLERVESRLKPYRRIGHELHVVPAQRVVLQLELTVTLAPSVIPEQVKAGLNDRFNNRYLADGTPAFFHPDRQTFGDGVYASQIVAEALKVPGIEHVEAKLGRTGGAAAQAGNEFVPLKPGEIIRFDNDPRHTEFGKLEFDIKPRQPQVNR